MAKPIPADRTAAIVAALRKWPKGASFIEVAASLNPFPAQRNVQRWLNALVREKRVIRVGRSTATRYLLPDQPPAEPGPGGVTTARAVQHLVTLPLSDRVPAKYRRVLLDQYRPGETVYLSDDSTARKFERLAAPGWREKPALDRLAAELAATILALEDAFDSLSLRTPGMRRIPPPTAPDLIGWMAQRPSSTDRADVLLAWNIRSVLDELVNCKPAPVVSAALLGELYSRVTDRVLGRIAAARSGRFDHITPTAAPTVTPGAPPPLRTSSLVLPATVYCPPADRALIEPCFDGILRVATAITDPLEQSLFLLVHLLYLLPFPALNAAMALLIMNVPLLSAGLPPITFAAVTPGDLLAGIRGVWELGRTELLRDAFVCGK